MKKNLILLAATCMGGIAALNAGTAPVTVKWIMGENHDQPRQYSSQFVITNVTDSILNSDWGLYYNIFPNDVTTASTSPATVSEIVPNYYVIRPNDKYRPLAPGDSIVVDITMRGTYTSQAFAPDGGHFAFNDHMDAPIPVKIIVPDLVRPSQWSIPGKELADYPGGVYVYRFNESVNPKGAKLEGSAYNIFPTPKSIVETGETLLLTDTVTIVTTSADCDNAAAYLQEKLLGAGIKINDNSRMKIHLSTITGNNNKEYYELTVGHDGNINIAGASGIGVLNGVKTLVAVIENKWAMTGKELPCVKITDYPDLKYRGVMIDIARNYTRVDDLKRMIDLLASYKINYYQFHFNDDEAWRLEIPGLPELTEVGSRKGLTLDEKDFLIQTYRGTGNPNDSTTTANGYYTREQFIDFLKYAHSRGVTVIPEIETPGHSRSAIISMKHRYARYIDTDRAEAERYMLWDDRDTSVYTSAQGFHDNILCIGQEGSYRFIQKVVDELALMYEEAGLKLNILHIGGDEVPDGSWEGSPVVHKMMQENGFKTVREARNYFVERITSYLYGKGIKVTAWQEMAIGHSDEADARLAKRFAGVNAWSTVLDRDIIPYSLANAGYPVILSNVNNFYFDMVYSRHQDEEGLSWGGSTDEFASWQAQPFDIYRTRFTDLAGRPIDLIKAADGKPRLEKPENIVGVQGQVWAETVRNFGMVQAFVFPKLFGLAERGWNARPSWGGKYKDLSEFYAARVQYNLKVGTREMPRLFNKGVKFRIGQPGLMVQNGMLIANTRYPGMTVRYTLDGSMPTRQSPQWTAPVPVGNAKVIKARAYYLGRESVATFLFLTK